MDEIRYFTHPDGIRVYPSGDLLPTRHRWLYPFALELDVLEALSFIDRPDSA